MKEYYRKLFEPKYQEAAPDAVIDTGPPFDINNPTQSRIRLIYDAITTLTIQWQRVFCYPEIMKVETENITINSDGYNLPLRIYKPCGNGPYKTMVFIHGGGWMLNSIDVYDYVHRYFARYGNILVIAPEYRLAPENKFPLGFNDCYNTTLWAKENCKKYNGDKNTLSICGDSAGGNLSAAVCLKARDEKIDLVKKQFLIFPSTALKLDYRTTSEKRYGNGEYFLAKNSETDPPSLYISDTKDINNPYVSPLFSDNLNDLPPAMFLSAECDPLLDQGLMYAAKLKDNGNEVEYKIYEGMVHAFLNRPQQKTFEAMNDIISAMP